MTATIHTFEHVITNHLSADDRREIARELFTLLADELVPAKGLTPDEACAMLGCSSPFLITLERDGLLRPFRHGTKFVRYDQRQIARLLSTGCGVEQEAAA
jgi:hypothetical protein